MINQINLFLASLDKYYDRNCKVKQILGFSSKHVNEFSMLVVILCIISD